MNGITTEQCHPLLYLYRTQCTEWDNHRAMSPSYIYIVLNALNGITTEQCHPQLYLYRTQCTEWDNQSNVTHSYIYIVLNALYNLYNDIVICTY